MTTPQDPNQPVQPGASVPGGAASPGWGEQPSTTPPDQPGWAAPQPPNQPAWGAPPPPGQPAWGAPHQPAQPGWGAPPPAGQPGWGAPPAGQPGWGAPQPGFGGQPGWGAPPKKGHGCLIAFLVVLVLIVVGIAGCAIAFGSYITTDIKLYQDLGTDRVSSVSFQTENGTTTWIIHLKAGYDSESQAHEDACNIVWVDLQGTQFANSPFELVDSSGYIVASNTDTCP